MASKMNKSYKAEISGILSIEDGIISVLVENVEESILLANFVEDFNDKEVKISIGYKQDV